MHTYYYNNIHTVAPLYILSYCIALVLLGAAVGLVGTERSWHSKHYHLISYCLHYPITKLPALVWESTHVSVSSCLLYDNHKSQTLRAWSGFTHLRM